MNEIPAKILLTDDELKKFENNELDLSKAILRDDKIRAQVPLEINYEIGESFKHKPWPRYADDCPTCGTGKISDWEIFSYYSEEY